MDKARRLQYLEAMGIDVWIPRQSAVADVAENLIASDMDAEHAVSTTGNQWPSDPVNPIDARQAEAPIAYGTGPLTFEKAGQPVSTLSEPKFRIGDTLEQNWMALQHEVSVCRQCKLCETRTQTVFGVGNPHASWMLIGEAPGQDEDLQGEPFVGRAGQLLNEMLRAIGLKREQVYIANILKCRPPKNRDPEAEEVGACLPYLQQQIALLKPKLILAVGRIAAQNLLNTTSSLTSLRGRSHRFGDTPLVVVHHPAYLLRSPLEKAKAWEDLRFALSVHQKLE